LNLRIDLHCHSTASDGTFPPAEVVRLAHEEGVTALALTDHNTVAGLPEAAAEAARRGLDFLPGIEVSCAFPAPAQCTCSDTASTPGTRHSAG
jgi:hypothetical protein